MADRRLTNFWSNDRAQPPTREARIHVITSEDTFETTEPDFNADNNLNQDIILFKRFKINRLLLRAALRAGLLCLCSLLLLVIVLRALLPPIEPEHKHALKIPKSFEDLKQLNSVLQIYKDRHFFRVLISFISVYLYLQAFSIPGSMYMTILGGALYGYFALPLVCLCIATGATLCYFISSIFAPAILSASNKWRIRLDGWKLKLAKHNSNLLSYLIVLRIAPLPPVCSFFAGISAFGQ